MGLTATKLYAFSGHRGPVYTIARSHKKGMILSGSSDKMIGSWLLNEHTEGDLSAMMPTHILALLGLEDEQLIIAGTSGGTMHFIDPVNRQEKKTEQYFQSQIFDFAFSSKHRLLFASSGDGQFTVTNMETLERIKTIRICAEKVRALALHPNEDWLAVASGDGKIRIFSVPEMLEVCVFHAHNLSANSVCWHPEGKYLLSGGRDAHLNIWDPNDHYKQLHSIPAHNFAIYSIVFSPDGKYFATGSRDKTVKIWDAATFDLLLRISREKQEGHINSVNKVLWLDEGLVSAGDDRAIIVWEVSSD